MSRELRQSTAQTERIGPYLDKTDGVTEETALTPGTEISKDGAAFAAGPAGTHDAEGWYSVAFTTTHTNTLGSFVIKSQANATHLAVWHEFMVLTANAYDAKYGTDILDVSVTQWLGTAVPAPGTAGVPSVDVLRWNTALVATPTVAGVPEIDMTHHRGTLVAVPTVAGVPEVDITHLGGNATSLVDLKDFADVGYDPVANKVQGVVLVDTTTTNTDVRGTDAAALASVCTAARLGELDAANLPADIDAILVDTGTTLDTKINDIQGAGFVTATDSLEAIRDRGDAAWLTGAGGTGLSSISSGTAQGGAVGSITLAAGEPTTTDIFIGDRVLTTGGTGPKQTRIITAYNGTTKVATVGRNFDIAPDATTLYEIQSAEANVETIRADSQSVIDLKDFADVGYDPATNKVQGVVLVDTTTTNTDVRGTDSAALASVCTEVRLAELDAANLPTDVAAVKTDTAAILVDTADIQPKIGAPATDLAADIAAVKTEADKIALADAGAGVAGSVIEEVENRALATVCTEVRLAELDAANLPTDVAAVKTDTAAILVDTGTTLDTKINDIQGTTFSSATDSLEAIRDRGDAAWITATSVAVSAGGITAASFAANAIDAAAIANAAIDAATFAAGAIDAAAIANGAIDAATFAANAIDAAALATDAVNEIADGLLDRANGIETGATLRQAQRLILASTAGKLSGLPGGVPAIFRNAVADSKARITATTDADGNRTAITWDVT